ncbi:hypothetical protein T492DRAFT_166531 [Pavlovales sp. CCMP2436]|nr:hypothetical protein T492DRAFT_166531 [Pavlovales sp. CCMP2436]
MAAPELRTLVLSHPDCLKHTTRDGHQEAPGRMTHIMGKLTSARIFDKSYALFLPLEPCKPNCISVGVLRIYREFHAGILKWLGFSQ